MAGTVLLKMCAALPQPIQDMIPEKYDTLWCDGYNTYYKSSNCQHLQDELYTGDYPDYIPLIPNKQRNPFKIPNQEIIQKIYKELTGLSFDCCYLEFKKWNALNYLDESSFNMFLTGDWTVLWLCFFMAKCFNKWWDVQSEKWRGI